MTPRDLIQQGMWEYQRLLRKSKAKNITTATRTSILQKVEDIKMGIEYIIQHNELDTRTVKVILPRWEEIKENN